MPFDVTYGFDTLVDSEADWNFTDPVGTGLQTNNTARRWCWHDSTTTSSGVGPDIGQTSAGYVYTEMSSPGANGDVFTLELDADFDASSDDIIFSYYFLYRGDGNNGTIQLQSNEGGAGWVNRGAAEVIDQAGVAQNATPVWLQKTVDMAGTLSGAVTRFRLVITQGTAGTSWHKDVGIDTVRVQGIDNGPIVGYSAVIDNLGMNHHWVLESDATDSIGSTNGTNTSMLFTASPIAEDATNSMSSNATTDRISFPTTADINNSAQTRKVVCGWFMTDRINPPPKRIYGEGNATTTFQFVMAYGNNVMFECVSPSYTLQIFGPVLEPNRAYHLCGVFEGNGFSNKAKFYVDGVLQELAEPTNMQPDAVDLPSRGIAELGDPAGTVGVGGDAVLLNAPLNGFWNHWATGNGITISDTDIRRELFEKGAQASITITSGTQAAMQAQLDLMASTVRPDAPLAIRVEGVAGGGDFSLTANNITFDPRCSIHVQYIGSDTLTWVNSNGANASIGSSIGSGSIIFAEQQNINVTVLDVSNNTPIEGARVFIEATAGGSVPVGTNFMNTTTNASGVATSSFLYDVDQPIVGKVRKGSSSTYYKTGSLAGVLVNDTFNITILLVSD